MGAQPCILKSYGDAIYFRVKQNEKYKTVWLEKVDDTTIINYLMRCLPTEGNKKPNIPGLQRVSRIGKKNKLCLNMIHATTTDVEGVFLVAEDAELLPLCNQYIRYINVRWQDDRDFMKNLLEKKEILPRSLNWRWSPLIFQNCAPRCFLVYKSSGLSDVTFEELSLTDQRKDWLGLHLFLRGILDGTINEDQSGRRYDLHQDSNDNHLVARVPKQGDVDRVNGYEIYNVSLWSVVQRYEECEMLLCSDSFSLKTTNRCSCS